MLIDILEFLGAERIDKNSWNIISKNILILTSHSDYDIKHAAVYGIGIMGKKGGNLYSVYSNHCLNSLNNVFVELSGEKKKKSKVDILDLTISSLGKIIFHQFSSIPSTKIINEWIKMLPLKVDKKESREMMEILLSLSNIHEQELLGENYENIDNIIKAISQTVYSGFITKQVQEEWKNKLLAWTQKADLRIKMESVFQSLNDLDKSRLKQLMGN